MNIPKIFKPEDFDDEVEYEDDYWGVALFKKAQSIFEAWLKENGKVVYGQRYPGARASSWHDPAEEINGPPSTHHALLINIQEIEKKDHKCQPKYLETNSDYENQMTCACGKKLRVKYEVVE